MASRLKVSVALCTCNGAEFIEAQLRSILGQTHPPDEVIVSDDHSDDETVSIVKQVAERYPPVVRLVQNPTRLGYVRNFESAIVQASGDVIFLSDQDDLWFENKIHRMLLPFATRTLVGLVYCDALLTDSALRVLRRSIFEAREELNLAKRSRARELVRGPELGVLGATLAFRANLKPWVLPIDEEAWGHDHWIVFLAHAVAEVEPVIEPLMYYRRHARNSAYSRTLDGHWWKEWTLGVRKASMGRYELEARRWEAMVRRLKHLKANGAFLTSSQTIDEFILESEKRAEFAKRRLAIKRNSLRGRVAAGVRLLARGDYHWYARGLRSFGKDLLR